MQIILLENIMKLGKIGDKVEVNLIEDKMVFEAPLVLPFGTIQLEFDGIILSNKINGTLTLKLPDGNENPVTFSGEKQVSKWTV